MGVIMYDTHLLTLYKISIDDLKMEINSFLENYSNKSSRRRHTQPCDDLFRNFATHLM